MDEAGDDVFSSTALASDQDWNVGGCYFAEPRPNCLHDLRVSKNDVIRGNLAQRLSQRNYRKRRHKSEYPLCGECRPHALKVQPKHQTREEHGTTGEISAKCSPYEWLEAMIR